MKAYIFLILLFIVACDLINKNDDLSLVIFLDESTIAHGDTIKGSVYIKNNSNQTITIYTYRPYNIVDFYITDDLGKEFLFPNYSRYPTIAREEVIRAGEFVSERFAIYLFDTTMSFNKKKYTIQSKIAAKQSTSKNVKISIIHNERN